MSVISDFLRSVGRFGTQAGNEIFGGFPPYIRDSRKKSGATTETEPAQKPLTREEEARLDQMLANIRTETPPADFRSPARMDEMLATIRTPTPSGDVRGQYNPPVRPKTDPAMEAAPTMAAAPMPSMTPMPSLAPQAAAEPARKEGPLMAGARGLSQFLGFVPEGGIKNDAVTSVANVARALFRQPTIQQEEAMYNQSLEPERLRKAIASGDLEEIARIDPAQADQIRKYRQTELDTVQTRKQDLARAAMAVQRETNMPYGDAARFVNERMGGDVFTEEELAIAQQGGYAALASAFGREDPYRDRFMATGGSGVIDLMRTSYDDPSVLDLRFQDQLDKALAEINLLEGRNALTAAQAEAARENAKANIMRAQAAQRQAEAAIIRANKYDPRGGAAGGGFSDPDVISANMMTLEAAIERGRSAALLPSSEQDLSPVQRGVAAAVSTPGALDDPKTAAAFAIAFPERYRAYLDIRQSVLPLVQSLRTLPGMDAVRLADTEKEFERLTQAILNPFASYQQVEASLVNVKRLLGITTSMPSSGEVAAEYNEGDVYATPDGGTIILRNGEWERL